MPSFYALIDSVPGQEKNVEPKLRATAAIKGVERCKDGNFDFLVRIEAPSFDVVDDILRTYVQTIAGVKAAEPIADFSDYGVAVAEAKAKLG